METKHIVGYAVAGVIVTGFGVWGGSKLLKKRRVTKEQHETVNAAVGAIDQILKNNLTAPPGDRQLPSFSNAQLKIFADSLYTAMDGAGTTEATVESVFNKMRNDLDVLLLVDAYGVRDSENLPKWIAGDGMTEIVNDILEGTGKITYRFA